MESTVLTGMPTIVTKNEAGHAEAPTGGRRQIIPLKCKVSGCSSDLSTAPKTHQRFRLCNTHIKAPVICVDGVASRFCQQCSRFHPLCEFYGTNRTCQMMLVKNRARQRSTAAGHSHGAIQNSSAIAGGGGGSGGGCRPSDGGSRACSSSVVADPLSQPPQRAASVRSLLAAQPQQPLPRPQPQSLHPESLDTPSATAAAATAPTAAFAATSAPAVCKVEIRTGNPISAASGAAKVNAGTSLAAGTPAAVLTSPKTRGAIPRNTSFTAGRIAGSPIVAAHDAAAIATAGAAAESHPAGCVSAAVQLSTSTAPAGAAWAGTVGRAPAASAAGSSAASWVSAVMPGPLSGEAEGGSEGESPHRGNAAVAAAPLACASASLYTLKATAAVVDSRRREVRVTAPAAVEAEGTAEAAASPLLGRGQTVASQGPAECRAPPSVPSTAASPDAASSLAAGVSTPAPSVHAHAGSTDARLADMLVTPAAAAAAEHLLQPQPGDTLTVDTPGVSTAAVEAAASFMPAGPTDGPMPTRASLPGTSGAAPPGVAPFVSPAATVSAAAAECLAGPVQAAPQPKPPPLPHTGGSVGALLRALAHGEQAGMDWVDGGSGFAVDHEAGVDLDLDPGLAGYSPFARCSAPAALGSGAASSGVAQGHRWLPDAVSGETRLPLLPTRFSAQQPDVNQPQQLQQQQQLPPHQQQQLQLRKLLHLQQQEQRLLLRAQAAASGALMLQQQQQQDQPMQPQQQIACPWLQVGSLQEEMPPPHLSQPNSVGAAAAVFNSSGPAPGVLCRIHSAGALGAYHGAGGMEGFDAKQGRPGSGHLILAAPGSGGGGSGSGGGGAGLWARSSSAGRCMSMFQRMSAPPGNAVMGFGLGQGDGDGGSAVGGASSPGDLHRVGSGGSFKRRRSFGSDALDDELGANSVRHCSSSGLSSRLPSYDSPAFGLPPPAAAAAPLACDPPQQQLVVCTQRRRDPDHSVDQPPPPQQPSAMLQSVQHHQPQQRAGTSTGAGPQTPCGGAALSLSALALNEVTDHSLGVRANAGGCAATAAAAVAMKQPVLCPQSGGGGGNGSSGVGGVSGVRISMSGGGGGQHRMSTGDSLAALAAQWRCEDLDEPDEVDTLMALHDEAAEAVAEAEAAAASASAHTLGRGGVAAAAGCEMAAEQPPQPQTWPGVFEVELLPLGNPMSPLPVAAAAATVAAAAAADCGAGSLMGAGLQPTLAAVAAGVGGAAPSRKAPCPHSRSEPQASTQSHPQQHLHRYINRAAQASPAAVAVAAAAAPGAVCNGGTADGPSFGRSAQSEPLWTYTHQHQPPHGHHSHYQMPHCVSHHFGRRGQHNQAHGGYEVAGSALLPDASQIPSQFPLHLAQQPAQQPSAPQLGAPATCATTAAAACLGPPAASGPEATTASYLHPQAQMPSQPQPQAVPVFVRRSMGAWQPRTQSPLGPLGGRSGGQGTMGYAAGLGSAAAGAGLGPGSARDPHGLQDAGFSFSPLSLPTVAGAASASLLGNQGCQGPAANSGDFGSRQGSGGEAGQGPGVQGAGGTGQGGKAVGEETEDQLRNLLRDLYGEDGTDEGVGGGSGSGHAAGALCGGVSSAAGCGDCDLVGGCSGAGAAGAAPPSGAGLGGAGNPQAQGLRGHSCATSRSSFKVVEVAGHRPPPDPVQGPAPHTVAQFPRAASPTPLRCSAVQHEHCCEHQQHQQLQCQHQLVQQHQHQHQQPCPLDSEDTQSRQRQQAQGCMENQKQQQRPEQQGQGTGQDQGQALSLEGDDHECLDLALRQQRTLWEELQRVQELQRRLQQQQLEQQAQLARLLGGSAAAIIPPQQVQAEGLQVPQAPTGEQRQCLGGDGIGGGGGGGCGAIGMVALGNRVDHAGTVAAAAAGPPTGIPLFGRWSMPVLPNGGGLRDEGGGGL